MTTLETRDVRRTCNLIKNTSLADLCSELCVYGLEVRASR